MNKINLESIHFISNVVEIQEPFFLHPSIDTSGDLYIANVYGTQTIVRIKEKELDNSDGSVWRYPGQTKTCIYSLSENEDGKFDWDFLEEIY